MSKQCNHIQEIRAHSFTQAWTHRHIVHLINFPFFESLLIQSLVRCLVKVEEILLEYTVRAAEDESYLLAYMFSLLFYAKHSQQIQLEQIFSALTKLGITPAHCSRQCCEDCKVGKPETGHTANDMARLPRIPSLLFFVQSSGLDITDVDIQ